MKGVLFMCVANSARSQLAEGVARKLAPKGIAIFSAGSRPAGVNPLAIRVLAEIGVDAKGQRSKSASEVPTDAFDTVVTLCQEEVCPVLPGHYTRYHWPLADPTALGDDDTSRLKSFRITRDELVRRLTEFFREPNAASH
ncbi:MAG TPA: arsenate reductase ArsC [Thermoanaerobaculia bacterium]|jgi:arsenate reductase|nr:arsenate reductase ArsC [Thermoanaerobaculia bacterium]